MKTLRLAREFAYRSWFYRGASDRPDIGTPTTAKPSQRVVRDAVFCNVANMSTAARALQIGIWGIDHAMSSAGSVPRNTMSSGVLEKIHFARREKRRAPRSITPGRLLAARRRVLATRRLGIVLSRRRHLGAATTAKSPWNCCYGTSASERISVASRDGNSLDIDTRSLCWRARRNDPAFG
jgi:hypothetical protein